MSHTGHRDFSPGSPLNPTIDPDPLVIPNPLSPGNPILTIDPGPVNALPTGAGIAAGGAAAIKIKKKKLKYLLKLLPLLAPLLKGGDGGSKKGTPKILALAGGKAKVKIIVFPPIKKVENNEKTEVEAADDKVTGHFFLQLG